MSQAYLVSVILPVFNGSKYLSAGIESVLAQTYENFELRISDNCSTDDSFDIAQKFARQDSRIKLSRNAENIGLSPNFNKLIAECTGEYIELFSHDDLFEPTCLEKLTAALDSHPNVVLATSNRRTVDADDNPIGVERPVGTRVISGEEAIRSNMEILGNWISSPVMYRSKFRGTGFDPKLMVYGDLFYWLEMLEHGDLFYLDEILFTYRYHLNSGSTRFRNDMLFATELVRLADTYGQYMDRAELSPSETAMRLSHRMIQFVERTIIHGGDFEHLLEPPPFDFTREDLTEVERLRLDVHDSRRAMCCALLHTYRLYLELHQKGLTDEQQKARQS